jgi:lipoprotein signal peptidase
MKTRNFLRTLTVAVAVTAMALSANRMVAQNAANTSSSAQPATAGQAAPVELSYGVPQIVQLVQAKVSDNVILTYIHNSGNSYGLNADQIVYLRQQGVSDNVITAMLNQRTQVAQAAAQTATAQNYSDANNAQTATVVAQPTVTYVQTVPSSTVYVIPDTQTYQYYDWYYGGYYPYYGGYGWPYPGISVSVGFGGGHWGGYYRGGWGGGYRGGYSGGYSGGYHGGGGGWHGGGGGGGGHHH